MTETIKVTVRNKTQVYWKAECKSVSMVNKVGPFDILPEHSNFITLFEGEVRVGELSGKVWTKNCVRGVARVVSNEVEVIFLEE